MNTSKLQSEMNINTLLNKLGSKKWERIYRDKNKNSFWAAIYPGTARVKLRIVENITNRSVYDSMLMLSLQWSNPSPTSSQVWIKHYYPYNMT